MTTLIEQELSRVKLIINALYGATIVYAGVMYFIPSPGSNAASSTHLVFMALLGIAIADSVIAAVIFAPRISVEQLRKMSVNAEPATAQTVCATVKQNLIIMAALGEAAAIFGLAYYFMSGDRIKAWAFFALAPINYIMTISTFREAQGELLRLGRNV